MTIIADIADPLICFGTIMHGKTLHFLQLDRVQVLGCVTKYEAADATWKMATQDASQLYPFPHSAQVLQIMGDKRQLLFVSVSLEAESR
ncbi:hypothetical protein V2G26_017808 [Clonostachys chloroleuca]